MNLKILTIQAVTEPDSIPIQLRINYTVNFGLKLENSDNAEFINQFIEKEYKSILDEEVRINRNPRREDNRIHVALYFIKPTGKGLNEFDIQVMKKIGEKVNVIPLLAKSDTLTESEIELNKRLICKSIQDNNIDIYNFEEDEDEFRLIQDRLPFGIIGSNQVKHGKHVRSYPWGDVVIEDSGCDFSLFKNILFGSHLQDFKDNTIQKKYEMYRSEMLSSRSNSRDIF